MKVYNGEGMILGRLATIVAKEALLGEEVRVVNCEQIIISGDKKNTIAWELQRLGRGGYPLKSQRVSRLPERLVRRTIRGMLPWKIARGKEAYKRIFCYRGVPAELSQAPLVVVEKASFRKLPTLKYLTIGEICKAVGAKI